MMTPDTLFVLPFRGVAPRFGSPPRVCGPGASILGRVTLGRNARIGAYVLMRGDGHFVEIGDDFSIGDCSTVHIAHEVYPAIVGNRVTVGRNAVVHACTV